jgi:hypothetical protein
MRKVLGVGVVRLEESASTLSERCTKLDALHSLVSSLHQLPHSRLSSYLLRTRLHIAIFFSANTLLTSQISSAPDRSVYTKKRSKGTKPFILPPLIESDRIKWNGITLLKYKQQDKPARNRIGILTEEPPHPSTSHHIRFSWYVHRPDLGRRKLRIRVNFIDSEIKLTSKSSRTAKSRRTDHGIISAKCKTSPCFRRGPSRNVCARLSASATSGRTQIGTSVSTQSQGHPSRSLQIQIQKRPDKVRYTEGRKAWQP